MGDLLLVDDDAHVQRALLRMLRLRGRAAVRVGGSFDDALTAIEECLPSAALLDVHLPGVELGGIRLLKRLRKARHGMPVALITGDPRPDVLSHAFALHAHVLGKPPTPRDIDTFLEMVARSRIRNVSDALESACQRDGLSTAQRALARWVDGGNDVASYAAHAGVTHATVKTHARKLLEKTGDRRVRHFVQRIRRESESEK